MKRRREWSLPWGPIGVGFGLLAGLVAVGAAFVSACPSEEWACESLGALVLPLELALVVAAFGAPIIGGVRSDNSGSARDFAIGTVLSIVSVTALVVLADGQGFLQ